MARRTRIGAGRRGRPSALASIGTAELRRELERREGMLQSLMERRDELTAELAALEAEIGQFAPQAGARRGGVRTAAVGRRGRRGRPRAAAGGGGRRPRNSTNLVEALRGVLTGKTLSVSDVATEVQKAGYQTTSPNFRTIVNQALLSNPKVFKKVARGQYTAR